MSLLCDKSLISVTLREPFIQSALIEPLLCYANRLASVCLVDAGIEELAVAGRTTLACV